MINSTERLEKLRKEMDNRGIDALIIPSADPHQSEYVSDHWKTRMYFSSFSGSSGYLVVLKDYAALWTDSRYFLQAEQELKGGEIVLHKQKVPHAPEHIPWLCRRLQKGSKIGIEGLLFSLDQYSHLQENAKPYEHSINNVDGIIDDAWEQRPGRPDSKVYEHDKKFSGVSRGDKLNKLRGLMKDYGCDHYFVSALDEIAWLLNIRAWDVEYTPVVVSYLIIEKEKAYLYVDDNKVEGELADTLKKDNIFLKSYSAVSIGLSQIDEKECIYLDSGKLSLTLSESIRSRNVKGESLIEMQMAIKNDTEIGHIRNVMVKDGVALVRFFMWLENTYKNIDLQEKDLVNKLAEFRSEQALYVGESFGAIVGFKANGAIIHYSPDDNESALIKGEGMLLVDSGGQYLDGTTDITRTIYLGEAKEEHKRNFTLVLKGNIALQCIRFPEGTSGMQLDTLARMHLWNEGLNYGHGTGHGVGFFLRVHEPPQGFATSPTTSRGLGGHVKGMFTSNEPGFYKEGEYGIRIENLMICIDSIKNNYASFLEFESLTLFPISQQLMDLSMLDKKEKTWLNDYHKHVYDQLSPKLSDKEKDWLKAQCAEING